jgi:hypothetical protein
MSRAASNTPARAASNTPARATSNTPARATSDTPARATSATPARATSATPARATSADLLRALFLTIALTACSSSSSGDPEKASADTPTTSAPATTSRASSATPSSSATPPPPRDLSPPPPGASREDREKAALALLSGDAHAADLPLADTDPGADFEPLLRFALQNPMTIRQGELVVSGLDDAAVKKAVDARLPRFRLCYAEGLRHNPTLQGRVTVRIVLTAPGKPNLAQNAGSDVPDASIVRCVIETISRIDFPAPRAPQGTAVIPLLLSPG